VGGFTLLKHDSQRFRSVIGEDPLKSSWVKLFNLGILIPEVNTAALLYRNQVSSSLIIHKPQCDFGHMISLTRNPILLEFGFGTKSPKKWVEFYPKFRGWFREYRTLVEIIPWTVEAVVTNRHCHPGFVEIEYDTGCPRSQGIRILETPSAYFHRFQLQILNAP